MFANIFYILAAFNIKMKKLFQITLLVFLSVIINNELKSQTLSLFSSGYSKPKYFSTSSKEPVWVMKAFVQDQGKLWTSPLRIKKKQLYYWVPVIVATAATIRFDEEIYSGFKKYQAKNPWVDDWSPVITMGGDNKFVIAVPALFYIGGLALKNEKAKQTGALAIQSLAHAAIIVRVGKMIAGRQRPSVENGIDGWYPFPQSLDQFDEGPFAKYDAFPSGHTIAAWSLATVIAKQYSETKIVPVLAYSFATAVGLSRITEDTHWISDVILGAALGYGISTYIVKIRSNTRLTLFPQKTQDGMVISAVYSL